MAVIRSSDIGNYLYCRRAWWYKKQGLISEIYENARVLSEEYDEDGGHLRVRAHPAALDRLRSLVARGHG